MSRVHVRFFGEESSTRGIATAPHCAKSLTQREYSLTFKGSHDGWWGDVQWHTSAVAYEADDFYSGSSSAYRVYLRDVAARGTATEGQRLCRNGKITYKKCDTVHQLNHCSYLSETRRSALGSVHLCSGPKFDG